MSDGVDALVIFGATGDLAKIETFPALVGLVERDVLNVPVIGVSKRGWDLAQFRDYATASLKLNNMDPSSPAAVKMLGLLRYVDGDLDDDDTYRAMSDAIGPGERLLYYLEVPPFLFGRIAQGIATAGRAAGARVMVEKPFGTDLASSRKLNDTMHQYFPEEAIFRVDDWLAFEPVENVLFGRFANAVVEPLLNRDLCGEHPDHHGRGVRRVRPGLVLRQDRRDPGRGAEPHAAGAGHGDGRPAGGTGPDQLAGRQGAAGGLAHPADPRAHRPRPVRGLPRRRKVSTRTRPWRPSSPSGSPPTRGGGRTCPS